MGAVIATFTALFAGTTIYGDALPVALQLGAVAVVGRSTGRRAVVVAGVLAALAFTAKLSAVWGLATVVVWLVLHDRRRVPVALAAAGVAGAAVLGLAELLSSGRFHENLLGLSGADALGARNVLFDAPAKTWDLLRQEAPGTAVLLPLAAGILLLSGARRRLEVVELALLVAGAVTVVVMADVGAGFNHLLDLVVLVPLAVAGAAARAGAKRVGLALALALAVATAASLADVRSLPREAVQQLANGRTPERLRPPAFSAPLAEPVFTEDPTVAVQRGRTPVALDSYMLLRIPRERPVARRALVARFDRREFRSVVLFVDLDLRDSWWRTNHLGLDVARAIDRNYRLAGKVLGPVFAYRLLVPR